MFTLSYPESLAPQSDPLLWTICLAAMAILALLVLRSADRHF